MNFLTKIGDKINQKVTFLDSPEKCFKFSENMLNLLGYNIFNPKWYSKLNIGMKFVPVFIMIMICLSVIFGLICTFVTFIGNIEEQLMSVIAWVYGVEVGLRLVVFVKNREKLRKIDSLQRKHIQNAINGTDIKYRPIIFKYMKKLKPVLQLVIFLYVMAVFTLIVFPFFLPGEWLYPMNFLIPGIPRSSNPGFTINYIFISHNIMLCVVFYLGFDFYMILMSVFLAARFELCSKYFSKVGEDDYTTYQKTNQSEELKKALTIHRETVDIFIDYRDAMTPLVLIVYTSYMLIMCSCSLLLIINPFNHAMPLALAKLSQCFLYCACGELVGMNGFEVSTSIYSSKWYNLNKPSDRRLLLMGLAGAQRPCYISFSEGFHCNMETFAHSSVTTYRIFTFLKNLMG